MATPFLQSGVNFQDGNTYSASSLTNAIANAILLKTVITQWTAKNSPVGEDQVLLYDSVADALKSCTVAGIQGSSYVFYGGTDTGSANTYVVNVSPTPSAYSQGTIFVFLAATANTGASTFNANDLGAIDIQYNGAALAANQILAGGYYVLGYNGSKFEILNPSPINWGGKIANVSTLVAGTTSITTAYDGKLVLCAATASITCTLPAASNSTGMVTWFKKTDSTANTVTITCSGSDTIDGRASGKLLSQYDEVGLYCTGAGWNLISADYKKSIITYTAGTSTLTTLTSIPLGCVNVRVKLWGAGGGGGGGNNSTNWRGTGGAAGGYTQKDISISTLGTSQTIIIATGGTGGAAGNPSNNGLSAGTSTFGSILTATGGTGGLGGTSLAQGGVLPGVGSGGDLNLYGDASDTIFTNLYPQVSRGGNAPFLNGVNPNISGGAYNYGCGGSCGNHTGGSGGNGGDGFCMVELL